MNLITKNILTCFVLLYLSLSAFSQNNINYTDNIKSIQLEVLGADFSYPVITLHGEEQLLLQFDCLSNEYHDYYYRFSHCNSDWSSSTMQTSEYIEGFFDNQITESEMSMNTIHSYYHYELTFPNEDFQFKLSGNYFIEVYADDEAKELLFRQRFFIVDPAANIGGSIKRSVLAKHLNTHQQIDFTVSFQDIDVNDPYNDVKIVIVQNNNWHISKTDLKPTFVKNKQLIYNNINDNAFPGNNEFRVFDTQSLKYNRDNVSAIFYEDSTYYVRLMNDKERRFKVYLQQTEINGNYFIHNRDYDNGKLSSEYTQVYFYLDSPKPFKEGDVYVYGGLSNWNLNSKNKMVYNYEKKAYQLMLLLKQGYYNYEYVYVDKNGKIDIPYIESSHYETENNYQIFVYAKGFGDEYERLVAYQVLNSLRDNHSIFQGN